MPLDWTIRTRARRILLTLIATALVVTAIPVTPAQDAEENGDLDSLEEPVDHVLPVEGGYVLPEPIDDTPVMPIEAQAGVGPRVVIVWPVQPEAAEYEVYVNTDVEARPVWQFVEEVPQPEGDLQEETVDVVYAGDQIPEAEDGRETVAYAVLAVAEDGTVLTQGRVAFDPERQFVAPLTEPFQEDVTEPGPGAEGEEEDVFGDEPQEAEAATTTGTLLGIGALAVVAIAVLAYVGYKRRGD